MPNVLQTVSNGSNDYEISQWIHSFFLIRINFIRIMRLKIGEI